MSLAVLHVLRKASPGLVALMLLASQIALAQDQYVPSNTTIGAGDSASPVFLGNNARASSSSSGSTAVKAGSPVDYGNANRASSASQQESPFVKLMNQTNATMVTNANALANARAQKVAAEAAAREQAFLKQAQGSSPTQQKGADSADSDGLIFHYESPNDDGAPPPRLFHVD